MRRKPQVLAASIAAAALAMSCGNHTAGNDSDSVVTIQDYTADAEAWADSTLKTLTTEQKAAMLFMPAIYTRTDDATMRRLRHYASDLRVGGIILLKGDTLSARAIADSLKALDRSDMIVAIDAEWGLGMRLTDAPKYPINGDLAADVTEEEMFSYGNDIAAQAARLGISMILGPVVDVIPSDSPSYIGKRSFGSDPQRVAALGTAYAKGLEAGGVISVAKHFPGQGSIAIDSHKELPVLRHTKNQLDSIDLLPFRRYIDAGLSGVMVGHMAVGALDPEMHSSCMSFNVMTGLLRKKLGFNGLIITDALNMGGAKGGDTVNAILAGADIIIAPASTDEAVSEVVRAINSGRLPEIVINDRCRRILFYRYRFIGN